MRRIPSSLSFYWVDGYFEETYLGRIQAGDPAKIKLMGYAEPIRGHVESIARGITVANAEAGQSGLANVNPIYTWVWRSGFRCGSISTAYRTACRWSPDRPPPWRLSHGRICDDALIPMGVPPAPPGEAVEV